MHQAGVQLDVGGLQLGCPFGCGFCGGRNSKSLRQIRNRSVESILFEVEYLNREHGYSGFMFYDDELNVSKSFVELMNGLSDLQSRLGTEFRLRGFVKSELFTLEQANGRQIQHSQLAEVPLDPEFVRDVVDARLA